MALVVLTPASRGDAAELLRANAESRAHHEPWARPPADVEAFGDWFDTLSSGANISLVAREAVSCDIAGMVNLSQIVMGSFRSACLGYYGSAALARRGLMTEAVRLATRYAFEDLGLHRLEANIQPANQASIALVRRLGFRKEGFSPRYLRIDGAWRDHERWALLADDPDN